MDNQLQETMAEKRINNSIKRVLKHFPQYKLVSSIDEGDVALIFDKKDTEHFIVLHNDDEAKENIKNNTDPQIVVFFLKLKNRRNSKQQVLADIHNKKFLKQK